MPARSPASRLRVLAPAHRPQPTLPTSASGGAQYLSPHVLAFIFLLACCFPASAPPKPASGFPHPPQSSPRVSHAPHFCALLPAPLVPSPSAPHLLLLFGFCLLAAVLLDPSLHRVSSSVYPSIHPPFLLPSVHHPYLQPTALSRASCPASWLSSLNPTFSRPLSAFGDQADSPLLLIFVSWAPGGTWPRRGLWGDSKHHAPEEVCK